MIGFRVHYNELKQYQKDCILYHMLTVLSIAITLFPYTGGLLLLYRSQIGVPLVLVVTTVLQLIAAHWLNEKVSKKIYTNRVYDADCLSQGCALLAGSLALFHVLAILFGAPLFDNALETFYLSCIITALTTLPLVLSMPASHQDLDRVFFARRPETVVESAMLYIVCGVLLGAWCGAFTIPLDWDRSWQAWPVPCFTGALLGQVVGHVTHVMAVAATKIQPTSKKGEALMA